LFSILNYHLHNVKDFIKLSKMPRLSIDHREKIVNLFFQHHSDNQKERWKFCIEVAENEGIIIGVIGIRKLMNKWFET
jgi:hypothetical protein